MSRSSNLEPLKSGNPFSSRILECRCTRKALQSNAGSAPVNQVTPFTHNLPKAEAPANKRERRPKSLMVEFRMVLRMMALVTNGGREKNGSGVQHRKAQQPHHLEEQKQTTSGCEECVMGVDARHTSDGSLWCMLGHNLNSLKHLRRPIPVELLTN